MAGLPLASVWRRGVGFVADGFLLATLVIVLGAVLGLPPPSATGQDQSVALYLVNLLVQIGYYWLWNSLGWSPGKRLVGLRTVDERGEPPGVERGFRRTVISLLSSLALFVGYVWALWDRRRQTWHDRAAGTYVVVSEHGGLWPRPRR